MASRISQMRNAALQPQQQQRQLSQEQLNESIARTRATMQQCRMMNNPEAAMMALLQQNPQLGQLSSLLRQGNSLEGIAKNMAQMGGYDINEIINQLGGTQYDHN